MQIEVQLGKIKIADVNFGTLVKRCMVECVCSAHADCQDRISTGSGGEAGGRGGEVCSQRQRV